MELYKIAQAYIPMDNSTVDSNTDPNKNLGRDSLALIGGTSLAAFGTKKYLKTRANTKDYLNQEKKYKQLLKDIISYEETNNMSDALKELSKKYKASNASAMKAVLKDEYKPIVKARGYKALGLIGLATGLYGAKKTLDDINPHPVLDDIKDVE